MTLARNLRKQLALIPEGSARPALSLLALAAVAGLAGAAAAAGDAVSGAGAVLAQNYGSPPPQNYAPPPSYPQQPYYGGQPAPQPYGAQPAPGHDEERERGAGGEAIHISDATYAADPRTQCDAAGALRERCEDKPDCRVRADDELCGDPARGRRKTLIIGFKCGGKRHELRLEEGQSTRLHC